MSDESPATPAVAAAAGDSRPDSKLDSATNDADAAPKQDAGKPVEGEKKTTGIYLFKLFLLQLKAPSRTTLTSRFRQMKKLPSPRK
jgi:hypothetical protein